MATPEFQLPVALFEEAHRAQNVVSLVESAVAPVEVVDPGGVEDVVFVVAEEHHFAAPGQAVAAPDPLPGMRGLDVGARKFGRAHAGAEAQAAGSVYGNADFMGRRAHVD